jgi:3-hydroxypropanoate dehydrogenase
MSTSTEASALAIDDRTAALLFRDAHTAYAFTDQPVTDEQLAAIYDLVRHAPTAMNSQPLRITYIRSEAAKERLLPRLERPALMPGRWAGSTRRASMRSSSQARRFGHCSS